MDKAIASAYTLEQDTFGAVVKEMTIATRNIPFFVKYKAQNKMLDARCT